MNPLLPGVKTFTDYCQQWCCSHGDEKCVRTCVARLKIQKFFWAISQLSSRITKIFQEINPTLSETSKDMMFTAGVICLTLYLNRAFHEKDSITCITKVAWLTLGITAALYSGSGDLGRSMIYTGIVSAVATINCLCIHFLLPLYGKLRVQEHIEETPKDETLVDEILVTEILEDDTPVITVINVDDLPGKPHRRKKQMPLSLQIPQLPETDIPEPIRQLSPEEESEILEIIKRELRLDPLKVRASLEKFRINLFSNPKYDPAYELFKEKLTALIKAKCSFCDCRNKFDVIPFIKTLQTCPTCQTFCYCTTHKQSFRQRHLPTCH